MRSGYFNRLIIVITIVLVTIMWFKSPPEGLSVDGWRTLIVIALATIFWITNVIAPAFTSLIIIFIFIVFGISTPDVVFMLWSSSLVWFIIGAFIMAGTIRDCGIGERFVLRIFGGGTLGFSKMISLIYIAQLLLAFIIPHPFPRNLILMSCLYKAISSSKLLPEDKAKVGFIIFSSTLPISTLMLTGDSVLNPATVVLSGSSLSWFGWFKLMSIPAVVATIIIFFIHYKFFKIDKPLIVKKTNNSEKMLKVEEKIVIFWLALAILGWTTDFIHGIEPAWITLGAAIGMSLPFPHSVLKSEDINRYIQLPLLLFLTGAMAIGMVSQATGLSGWLINKLLPGNMILNDYALGLILGGFSIFIHMLVGSVLATISVAIPPLVEYASRAYWDPLFTAMVVNVSANLVFFFPFQNTAVMLGLGKVGFITRKETFKFGILMVAGIIFVILTQVTWWKIIGLL